MNIIFKMHSDSIKVKNRIARTHKSIKQGLESGKKLVGRGLIKETRRAITNRASKTGRVYQIQFSTGRRRRHKSSAPGETHANLTGLLRSSVSYKTKGSDIAFGYGLGAKPAPVYARTLEFGGAAGTSNGRGFVVLGQFNQNRRGGRISPRPSIANGIKSHNKDTIVILRNAIDKAIKR